MGNAEYMGLASNAAPAPEHPDPDSSYASPGSGNSEWTLGAPAAVASALRGGLRSGSGYYCGGTWNGNNNDGSNYEGPLANTGIDQCKSPRSPRARKGQVRANSAQPPYRMHAGQILRGLPAARSSDITRKFRTKKKKKKKKKKFLGFYPSF